MYHAIVLTNASMVIAGILAMLIAPRLPSAGRFIALALAIRVPVGLLQLWHFGLRLPSALAVVIPILSVATHIGLLVALFMGLRAALAPRRVTLFAVTTALAILSIVILTVASVVAPRVAFTNQMIRPMLFLGHFNLLSGAVVAWLGVRTDGALRWVALGLLVPGLSGLLLGLGISQINRFFSVADPLLTVVGMACYFLLLYGASRLGQSKAAA